MGYIGEQFGVRLAPIEQKVKKVFKYIKGWLDLYPEGFTIPFGYFYDKFSWMTLEPNNYFKRRLSKYCKNNGIRIRFSYEKRAVSMKYD